MTSLSKTGSSRRKGDAPGKIKILMNGGSGKVVHNDSDEDEAGADVIPDDLPEGTVIVEPQPVQDFPAKKKKEAIGRIDTSVLDNVSCSGCGRQINPFKSGALQKHPELKVVICKKCEKFLSSGEIAKDKDGVDEQCRWCGEGGRLVMCDDCTSAFCKACVIRNFNRSEFNKINDQDSWKCFLCDKSQLEGLKENYRKIRDTLKALQAKQKAKEQMNGAKVKETPGSSVPSRSNDSKAIEIDSSSETEAQPVKILGSGTSASDSSGAIRGNDLALTVGDLAVDSTHVDSIMDKLSTATNTFREMLRALRSQFHSTSPRATDDDPPSFKFSLSVSMDINIKKQRCAKALNKGLITYLQSLRKILHKDQANITSEALSKQVTLNVEPFTKKGGSKTVQKNSDSSQSLGRKKPSDKDDTKDLAAEKHSENSKLDSKTGKTQTSPRVSQNEKSNNSINSSTKTRSSKESEKKVQSQNKDKCVRESEENQILENGNKSSANDISQEGSSKSNFNIDDEENVAAKLDLIQELAEEMLKGDGDDKNMEKETDMETEPCEEEEEKQKRKVDNAENIPLKKTKRGTDNDLEKVHSIDGEDNEIEKSESDVEKSKQNEEVESSSDPLSSDDEQPKSSTRRKKTKRANTDSKQSTNSEAKSENTTVTRKKGGKLQLSKNLFSSTSKEKNDEEKSSLDKEIDKLAKLPVIQKKRKLSENKEESTEVKENDIETKKDRKSKPGPKSSKKGKDLELSSDSEDKAEEEEADFSEEDDDMEPKVTFCLEPEQAEKEKDQIMADENELSKKQLLEESDEDSESDQDEENKSSDSSSDSSDVEEKSKRKRKANKGKDSKKKEDETKSDEGASAEEDSENNIGKKSKRIRSKLLNAKLSESDSEAEIKPGSKKKKKDEDSKENSSSGSSIASDSSDKDGESEEEEEESEGEEGEKKSKKKRKQKQKKGKRKGKKKGATDDEEEEEEKKGKGKKRKRIKRMSNSSDEAEGKKEEDSDEDDANSSKFGKRKKIRKVMSNKKLEDSTKAAAKAEEKRRKRIASKQREFNIETITDENNPMNCPVTTKLVLEPGKEEGDDPIVQVNKKLIRKLKPHQVEAVQFMWDCLFESVKRSKKETGSGCILAHCMGLGKTLSVISFVHTVLTHEKLNMRTCLVVCPLNTVLNWRNEWSLWLDKKDQLEVWELAGCKQNVARADALKEWHESGGIMIMGYEMYRNLTLSARVKNKRQKKIFQETLVNPGPDLVICDEGHILKNENSAVSKAMNQMTTRRRVVLTGTPLQNNLTEYHCMVSFVKPNLLGTRKEFTNRFISPIQNGQCTDSTPRDVKIMKARAHVLHEMLAGCVQRRDYSALTKFLPPKQEYVISVRMAEVQVELYEKYLEVTGQGIDGVFNNKGARLFKDYQNLMKIWTHPWVLKLAEIRDELKMKFEDDDDSFIDNDSEEKSFSSSESSSDDDEKKYNSDSSKDGGKSLGPHSKRGTRRTRAKARRQAGEDSDPEEVIAEWKSKTRSLDEEATKSSDVDKTISNEWWAQYVCEDDKSKLELSNKLYLLFEILRMCEEIGDKVLIFSQSILTLNIIENFLETVDSKFQSEMDNKPEGEETNEDEAFGKSWTKHLDYYRMDGSTSAQNRQIWAENFNDVDNYRARLFLISTKAGGLGINLVAANRVIIFDASWNPSHDVQSIFRVYRFGQTKPCYIYRFLAQGTMEEKIYERQVTKLSLSQRVVDEHQIERHFSANDLKELYNFRPDHWDEDAIPTLDLPKDPLLAEILKTHRKCVVSFHEHDSLLENQIEQTLTEEEKKAAWEEYENEKKGIIIRGPGMDSMNRTASWPMMAAAQILSREQITATVQALRQQLPDLPEDVFHLHVQQSLRRQVQMKQEEERRRQLELVRMQQQMNYLNMLQGPEHGRMSMQNLPPWMQMQMGLMQNPYMRQNLGAYGMAGMSTPGGNNPEEPIDLDESPTK